MDFDQAPPLPVGIQQACPLANILYSCNFPSIFLRGNDCAKCMTMSDQVAILKYTPHPKEEQLITICILIVIIIEWLHLLQTSVCFSQDKNFSSATSTSDDSVFISSPSWTRSFAIFSPQACLGAPLAVFNECSY